MSVEKIIKYDCPVYLMQHPCVKEPGQLIVTSPYGTRSSGFHYGLDSTLFANDVGNLGTIIAFADGKVIDIWDVETSNKTYQKNSGNYVIIDHNNGYVTKYFHLQLGVSNYVKVGQTVKKGTPIGYMGNTGHSNGGHLHFEVLVNGKNVDPLPYMIGEKSFNTAAETTVKTYKVLTTINGYNTAGDAAEQKNPSTTIKPATYYVYNKYPDGFNGMYNITTNPSGDSPWCWVNPKENVEDDKWYRVRKSKDDAASQIGAYKDLQIAKDNCKPGYSVFDWDWNVVYSYDEAHKYDNVAVYDLPYENKVRIIDKSIKRTNEDCVRAIKKILEVNPKFDVNIAKAFFKIAPKYGIDPMMAISQSILETGWFKFNSPGEIVTEDQHNYGAMGVTDTGVKGDIYDTIEDGVIAQMQHLWAYACKDALPNKDEAILDKRYKLVSRGCAPYWQQLAGRWAWPGYEKAKFATPYEAMLGNNTYGQLIQIRYSKLLEATATQADVDKYFPKEVVETPEVKEPEVVVPEVQEPEIQEPVVEQKPIVQETPEAAEPKVEEPIKEPAQSESVEENPEDSVIEEKTEQPGAEASSKDTASIILDLLKKLINYIINLFKK